MSSNLEKALGFNLEAFNYLYVLCDYETLLKKNITLENFLEILKKYDVKLLQYRDKVSDLELQKQNLIFLKQNLNIPIIVNDKVYYLHAWTTSKKLYKIFKLERNMSIFTIIVFDMSDNKYRLFKNKNSNYELKNTDIAYDNRCTDYRKMVITEIGRAHV